MSAHRNLPIYKATYQLLKLVAEMTRSIRKEYRLTLGVQVKDECAAMVVDVYRASAAADKSDHITRLLERLEVVQLLLQLLSDLRLISLGQLADTLPLTDAIGKQAGGWRKASRFQRTPGA